VADQGAGLQGSVIVHKIIKNELEEFTGKLEDGIRVVSETRLRIR
jgi:hypothetical protein